MVLKQLLNTKIAIIFHYQKSHKTLLSPGLGHSSSASNRHYGQMQDCPDMGTPVTKTYPECQLDGVVDQALYPNLGSFSLTLKIKSAQITTGFRPVQRIRRFPNI